jgi:hypothetical protein
MRGAANGGFEPTAEVFNLCCVRSQRTKCFASARYFAAAQRENRPFIQTSERISESSATDAWFK